MSKFVYLDSNDFSRLSEEKLSADEALILTCLREKRTSEEAQFFASPIHISEAVQANEKFRASAVRRAALIRELCGTNMLIFPDELHRREIRKAMNGPDGRLAFAEITSHPNEWFGIDPPESDSPDDGLTSLAHTVSCMTRAERRALRPKLKKIWAGRENKDTLVGLLGEDFTLEWIMSGADPAALAAQIKKTLRDPYTLFDHVAHKPFRRILYDAVRKSGSTWVARLDSIVESSVPTLVFLANSGARLDIHATVGRTILSPSILTGLARHSAGGVLDSQSDTDVLSLARRCPSLSLQADALRAYGLSRYEATLTRIRAGNPSLAPTRDSDFGDFLHCAYAPYVDVFRCDSRFGELLKAHKPTRARIVSKRSDLLTSL
jgi:hypothetical protein